MARFEPCLGCGRNVNVKYDCPYCAETKDLWSSSRISETRRPAAAVAEQPAFVRGVRLIDYRSTYGTGVFLQLLLGVYLGFVAWSFSMALPYLAALTDLRDSGVVENVDRLLDIEEGYVLAAGFQGAMFLLISIVWIVWFYRSYKNLEPLGRRSEHKAGWAIFGWVVPIVSLYRPRQIAGDLWVQSRPPESATHEWHPPPAVPWYFNVWWAIFIARGLLFTVAWFTTVEDTAESFVNVLRLELGLYVAAAVLAPFAIAVVRAINNRQASLARTLDVALARVRG